MTGGTYVHGRSAETNLAEIHEEMSGLNKQVNINKSLKKASGVHASSRKPIKKCAKKMKERKNYCYVKIFVGTL